MIVPMKKARLIVLKEDKDALLKSLQRCGEFMTISPKDEKEGVQAAGETDLKAQQAEAMLKFMESYGPKKGFLDSRPEISYDVFIQENVRGEQLAKEAEEIAERLTGLQSEMLSLKSENAQLFPWDTMDMPLSSIGETRAARLYTGYIAQTAIDTMEEALSAYDTAIQYFKDTPEGRAVLLIILKSDAQDASDAAKGAGFTEVMLPHVDQTAQARIQANTERITAIAAEIDGLKKQMATLGQSLRDLELLNEQYKAKQARESVRFSETIETVALAGWVRSDRMEKVEQAVQKVTPYYFLGFSDPEEGEQPPTVTKNKRFWQPFESITEMYSPPKPGTIDPTPVSAPWFWVIFGLMMGDFGYGAIMVILTVLFKKFKKPKGGTLTLITMLEYSSITTMLFGILFGSYFGETWHPILFSPLDNPVAMLVLSLIIGVLHMFCGMAIKIVEDVRAGHIADAIFDQVSWMLLITGAGLCFLSATRTVGIVLAIVGAVIVLFTAGREKPTIIGKVIGGISGLYGATSYLSDILSYSRILALSLATGVIAMVMNILAGMVQVNIIGFVLSLLIYLVGHVFNIAMSLLSAYVHDSRLQYIEFFNKFYEGGGYTFEPLAIRTKTVDVIDNTD